MNILMTGSTGFIGAAAVVYLRLRGHTVLCLGRSADKSDIVWEPSAGRIGPLPEQIDAVIHLAGENIFGRWTKRKKERIYQSRIGGTHLLAEHLAAMRQTPKVMVCASAVGYYGDGGNTVLTEQTPPGLTFLSRVCRDWEAAAKPAQSAGVRVVNLRLGMVLDKHGGALAKMLPAFRAGLGGVLGSGRQWVSWISLTDAVRITDFALTTETLRGPVNAVAPEPVTNRTFTKALAAAVHRPAALRVPATLLKLVLGDFAAETLLAGCQAIPERLLAEGFTFEYPELAPSFSAWLS